jgi:hypothetical protein
MRCATLKKKGKIMRALSLFGLLLALLIIGVLVRNQLNSPTSTTPTPTEAIDKANEAADKIEQRTIEIPQP